MSHRLLTNYEPGRHVAGSLPNQKDLIGSIEAICRRHAIENATFSVIGTVSSATIGVFDPVQKVHVTHLEKVATELLSCWGSFSTNGGKPCVNANVILSDQQGRLTGGHLFSETIVHDAEIDLRERVVATV